jgi:hypothetical protein
MAPEETPNGGGWQFIKGWAALVLPGTWAPRLACLSLILFVVSAGIPSHYEEILIVPAAVLLLGASVLTAYRIDIVYRDEPSGIGARFRQLFGLFRCIYGIAFLDDENGPEGYEEPDNKTAVFISTLLVMLFLSFVTGILVSLVAANTQYFWAAAFHAQYLGLIGRGEILIGAATLWFLIGIPNQAHKVTLGKNAGHALIVFVTIASCILTATYLFLLHFGVGPLSKVQKGPLVAGIVFTVALVAPVYKSLASGVLNPEITDERWSTLATEVRTALAQPARRQAAEGEPSPPPSVQQPAPSHATAGHGDAPPSVRAARVTSGLAIASLVLSILWLGGLGSLLAIIFGVMALWQIRQSSGRKQGAGLATAGLAIGSVGLLGIALLYTLTTTPTKITTADFTFQLPANWNANTTVTQEGGGYIVAQAHPDGLSGNIRVGISTQAGVALNSIAQISAAMPKILRLRGAQVSLVAGPTATSLDHAPAVEFQYDLIRGHKEFFGEQVWAVHSGYLHILEMITGAGDNQVPAAFQMALKTWTWR